MLTNTFKSEWEDSYGNLDNHLFYPNEEVIRFVSKYIRKRIGLNQFIDILPCSSSRRVLDLGCGIGRHVMYCHDMGLEAYGVDLSEMAIATSIKWACSRGSNELIPRLVQTDARSLPFDTGFFQYLVSHATLDSMPFSIARVVVIELARVIEPHGLFYCDLISGDDIRHASEFSGEEIVSTAHEKGTMQLYFNLSSIRTLFDGLFDIMELNLIRKEDVLKKTYNSRWHLVLRKI